MSQLLGQMSQTQLIKLEQNAKMLNGTSREDDGKRPLQTKPLSKSPPYHHMASQMDGGTGGDHGGNVGGRRPPEGHGPEVAYDESVNSSVNDINMHRNLLDLNTSNLALPNVS